MVKTDSIRHLSKMIRFAYEVPLEPEGVEEYGLSLLDLLQGRIGDEDLPLYRYAKSSYDSWKLPIQRFKGVSWDDLVKETATPESITVPTKKPSFEEPLEFGKKNQLVCGGEKKRHYGDFYLPRSIWNKFLGVLGLSNYTYVVDVKVSHKRIDVHVLCNQTLKVMQGNTDITKFWLELETCVREASEP